MRIARLRDKLQYDLRAMNLHQDPGPALEFQAAVRSNRAICSVRSCAGRAGNLQRRAGPAEGVCAFGAADGLVAGARRVIWRERHVPGERLPLKLRKSPQALRGSLEVRTFASNPIFADLACSMYTRWMVATHVKAPRLVFADAGVASVARHVVRQRAEVRLLETSVHRCCDTLASMCVGQRQSRKQHIPGTLSCAASRQLHVKWYMQKTGERAFALHADA